MGHATNELLRVMKEEKIQKMEQENAVRKEMKMFFRNFVLSSLYVEEPLNEEDIKRNTLIKSLGVDTLTQDRVLLEINQDFVLSRTDMKDWLTEICNQVDLKLCSVREAQKYKKENIFLYFNSPIAQGAESSMLELKEAVKGTRFGLMFLNHADNVRWTNAEKESFKDLMTVLDMNFNGAAKVIGVSPNASQLAFVDELEFSVKKIEYPIKAVEVKSKNKFFRRLLEFFGFKNNTAENVQPTISTFNEDSLDRAIVSMNLLIKRNKQTLPETIVIALQRLKEKALEFKLSDDTEKKTELSTILIHDIPQLIRSIKKSQDKEKAEQLAINILEQTFENFGIYEDEGVKELQVLQRVNEKRGQLKLVAGR